MNTNTDTLHRYPHQQHHEVTDEHLLADFNQNPDAYHEGLHPHIKRFLGEEVLAKVSVAESPQTAEQWIELLEKNDQATLTTEQAIGLLKQGYYDALAEFADRITNPDALAILVALDEEDEEFVDVFDKLQSTPPHGEIVDSLVEQGKIRCAIDFASDYHVTDYSHEELFQTALDQDTTAAVLPAIDLLLESGKSKVAFDVLVRSNNSNNLRILLAVIDELPQDAIDTNILLNVCINNGKAYSLYGVMDYLPKQPDFDWKRLCDAVIYEGYGIDLLNLPVSSVDRSVIDYKKILEQLQANDGRYFEYYLEKFIEHADATSVVQAMMRTGNERLFASYINKLKDAEVDFDALYDTLLDTLSPMSSMIEVGIEKLGAEVFIDKLFKHVPLHEVALPSRILALANHAGAGLVMQRVLDSRPQLDFASYSIMCTLLEVEPGANFDIKRVEQAIIDYVGKDSGIGFPRGMERAGLDELRICMALFATNPTGENALRLLQTRKLTAESDVDYKLLAERCIDDGVLSVSSLLDYVTFLPAEALPMDLILSKLVDPDEAIYFLEKFNAELDPKDPRLVLVMRRLLTNPEKQYYTYPDIFFEALEPAYIASEWMKDADGRASLFKYHDKLGGTIDLLSVFDSMSDNELSELAYSTLQYLINGIGSNELADAIVDRRLNKFMNIYGGDLLNQVTDEGTRKKLLEYLRDTGSNVVVARNLEQYVELKIDIDYKKLAQDLMDKQHVLVLLNNIDKFPEDAYSADVISLELMKDGWSHDSLFEFLKTHDVSTDTQTQMLAEFSKNSPSSYAEFIALFPNAVSNEDLIAFYNKLHDAGEYYALFRFQNIFPEGIYDINELADEVLADDGVKGSNRYSVLVNNLSSIRGLHPEYVDKIVAYIERETSRRSSRDASYMNSHVEYALGEMAQNLEAFNGYTKQMFVDMAMQDGYWRAIPSSWQDDFTIDFEKYGISTDDVLKGDDDALLRLHLAQEIRRPVSAREKTTQSLVTVFGEASTTEQSRLIYEITTGGMTDEMLSLGIAETGEEGLTKLRQVIDSMRNEVYNGQLSNQSLEQLNGSRALQAELARITRYEVAEWGSHDSDSLRDKISTIRLAERDDLMIPMPEEYQPSEVYDVQLLKEADANVITDDVKERYDILRQEMLSAVALLAKPRGLSDTVSELRSGVKGISQKIEASIDAGKIKPQAEEFQRNLLNELNRLVGDDSAKTYPLRSLSDIEKNFSTLAKHDELHPAMRKIIFAWALRKQQDWKGKVENLEETPSIDDISTMHDFIDQTVNDSTFSDYFSNKKTAQLFKRITSVKALEGALDRNQGKGVAKEASKMQIMPSRGLLLELSGHIGDACWADTYSSINEHMPNMSTILFRQNPGEKSERLAGAALLIETKNTKTNEDVLLLRGVNPLENYINKVSAESFYESVTDYVQQLAKKRGMQAAIVIDDHAGGSGTNRPALYSYLEKQKRTLTKVAVDNASTKFNGYNVTKDSYLI